MVELPNAIPSPNINYTRHIANKIWLWAAQSLHNTLSCKAKKKKKKTKHTTAGIRW